MGRVLFVGKHFVNFCRSVLCRGAEDSIIKGKGEGNMAFLQRKTALQKEWELLRRREERYLARHGEKKEPALTAKLEALIPAGLQSTLNTAFYKAFQLIFEKGTGIIEKSYPAEERKKNFLINDYSADVRRNKKNLRSFGKAAASAQRGNVLLSAAAGTGMGLLGIGIPDIPLFTSLLLKNIYEISASYGYDYKLPQEQHFILLLIEGAVSEGERLHQLDGRINAAIQGGELNLPADGQEQLRRCADALSQELLCMKFLQGIPIVGAVGGACDALIMGRVSDYARLKYQRRLLERKSRID